MNQYITLEQITSIRRGNLVYASGCFDLFHIGHKRFLQAAKQAGDMLLVGIESDATIRLNKGCHRPIFLQRERAELVEIYADYLLLFQDCVSYQDTEVFLARLQRIRPDYVAIDNGSSCAVIQQKQCIEVGIMPLVVPHLQGYSTTSILTCWLEKRH